MKTESFLQWMFAHPRLRSITLERPGMDPEVIRPEARVVYTAYSGNQIVSRSISYRDYSRLVAAGAIVDALSGPLPLATDIVAIVPEPVPLKGRHVAQVGRSVGKPKPPGTI